MAQLAEADIMVGSTRIAGRLQVDAGLIRSEACPLEPRLVVPVAIELSNRPVDQMLALTHLTGHLNLGDEHNPGSEVGLPARLDFIPGFHARSLPEGQTKFTTEFRFQLSPIAVHRIEAARHTSGGSLFELRIRCDAALAWIRKTGGVNQPSPGGGGTVDATDPFQLKFGMHSELSYFWTVEVRTLRIQMEPSAWISNVLPGLGIDTVRLVEVTFPPKFPRGHRLRPSMRHCLRSTESGTTNVLRSAEALFPDGTGVLAPLRPDRWVWQLHRVRDGRKTMPGSNG